MTNVHSCKIALAALWFAAVGWTAADVAADCSSPAEASDLTIKSVTIDGAEADADAHVNGTPPVTLRADRNVGVGLELRSGDYSESFPTGVAP